MGEKVKDWLSGWLEPSNLIVVVGFISTISVLFYKVQVGCNEFNKFVADRKEITKDIYIDLSEIEHRITILENADVKLQADLAYIRLRLDELIVDLRDRKRNENK